jgi:hypothetical protein
MKVEGILFFLIALLIVFAMFASDLLFWDLLILIGALGFSPFFWEAKDRIGSDLAFFALCTLSLYLMILLQTPRSNTVALSIALGVVIYLCYATRTVGIVLVICLALFEILTRRAVSRASVVSGIVAGSLIAVHTFFFRDAVSYADQIHPTFRVIAQNAVGYFWELRNTVWPFYGQPAARLFTLLMLGLSVCGYVDRIRTRLSVLEVYAAIYTTVIMLWTSEFDSRFLIPVFPLAFYYSILYVRRIAATRFASDKRYVSLVLLVVFTTSYASAYMRMNFGPIRQGIGDPRFFQVCQYIKNRTAPQEVVVFSKPRLLALMTDRRAAAYHQPQTDSELWRFFDGISADYVLTSEDLLTDVTYMRAFIQRQPSRIAPVFDNGAFILYRITR